MVYAGMGPDYRVLVTEARKAASVYSAKYGEPIPTEQLVMNLATVMQVRIIIIDVDACVNPTYKKSQYQNHKTSLFRVIPKWVG